MTSFIFIVYLRTEEFAIFIDFLAWQFVFFVCSKPLGNDVCTLDYMHTPLKILLFLYPMSVTMFQEGYLPYIYIWNSLHPFFRERDVSLILERKGKNIVFGLLLSSFQFPSPYVLQYFAANTVSALQIM